ncbi:hypothetical protein F5X99DRAFT_243215 [Biscogniauxia marginata]|nr:hypothetical protein F5X99DRAFT_243215 [Biscogniauxia marginata]
MAVDNKSKPCQYDKFLGEVGAPRRIHGPPRSSQYHEAHFWDFEDMTKDGLEAILIRYRPSLREARVVFEKENTATTACHVLLSWNKSRVVRCCELANDHREEPWSVQPLQKYEWETERAEFYMDGRSGLFVVRNNEDFEESIHPDGEGTTSHTVEIDPQHPLANPMRTIPSGISRGVLSSTSKDEFLSRMEKEHPQILIMRFLEIAEYVKQTYEWRIPVTPPCVLDKGTEGLPNDIGNWASNILRDGKPKKSLCIVGPSRTGKTVWAESLGPHVICNGDYNLQSLRSAFEASYAIFKNIDIRTFPWPKFVTGNPSIRICDRYELAEHIGWGIPSIFIFNEDPRLQLEHRLRDFWDSQVITVHISEALVG